ncbi:hypothetical protein [Synechococcus sp. PCC 7336]|uniref:hypothetical protein n=1 Tax=Synechococcus sp. PCC 7336 TaxID=195250 RepID=UPI0003480C63|nr:hypothetical protein [Synechococcus sp. PCC 7336]
MTLNRHRFLRIVEYVSVSASVVGAIAAVATRQLVYAVAPLSISAALSLANRRQWEHRIEQRLAENTSQVDRRLDRLNQQDRLIQQRVNSLATTPEQQPEVNSTIDAALQTLRDDTNRLTQDLSEAIQALRQELEEQNSQQENFVRQDSFNAISEDLQRVWRTLEDFELLNLENRFQTLEQKERQWADGRASLEEAIADARTNFRKLKHDLTQLKEGFADLRELLRTFPSDAETLTEPAIGPEPSEEVSPVAKIQWISPQLPSIQNHTEVLEINLGIDFGTGFTKVCFRDLARDCSEVVTFSEDSSAELEKALISTKIAILQNGTLLTGLTVTEWESSTHDIQKTLEFIKMRLAHLDFPKEADWRLEQISELDNPETVENLSAYYLSRVINRARNWIQGQRKDLFKNQTVRWSINLGVPVEYCDSPALERFQRVLSLAWLLSNTPSTEESLTISSLNLLGTYLRQWMKDNVTNDELDCMTTPEISAAVWSFLSSRQAREKFYTFFDFGDGTLDGAAFRFWRENEGDSLRVDFYFGQVRPLGVTAFIQQTASEYETSTDKIYQALFEVGLAAGDWLSSVIETSVTRRSVQKLIASVVTNGMSKHKNNRGILSKNELGNNLEVFLGGGGGQNPFFRNMVQATYKDFQHDRAGIPQYQIKQIPVPNTLSMNGLDADDFHRFAVAYGLSIPTWEGPEIRLPSQVEANYTLTPKELNQVTPYEDTKDLT